ncbi:hypothetical protein QBC43DRAFT_321228 [Cladorrhinum sp. PSN259]|nr:hypothetical protein QBC43DRAFT_321228 [Cladorrhinum sp. PSN259]
MLILPPLHSRSRWTIQKWTEAIGGLAVVTTLIVAIELTIKWNQIPAVVNQATTAAQLIPLLLVVALLVLFLYAYSRAVCYRYDSSSDSDNDITLSIAGSPSGGGSSSSSGGSDPEPLVVVVKRGSRSRSRSGPDIIRISHPSPTHRSPRSRRNTQPRPRGPRSPPERSRPSHPRTPSPNPQGSQSRGPRVIDVHPPPRPPSSSSSSSSSRFGPRVSGYRYPPHYPFPHIFRRQPFQPPARSLRRRGAAATTTTTPGGAHPWDHMLFASDPDQLPWVRHPQAATAVERYRVSTFSAATPEAAEATGTDIKEAPTDCDPKMKEEHDKMWEETFHPQDLISEEDLKECMADLPGLYTDADVKACLDKTDGVHISSADAADWLKKQEYYKQEDADKMVREGGHYTQQQADDIVREELYEQKDADDLVNGNDLYTEEDVEEVMNPKPQARIPQPTGEEGGESSRMAKARVRGMPVDFVSNASSDA